MLSSITHNGFSYLFKYDLFGNDLQTKVGSRTLISNTYAKNDYNDSNDDFGSVPLLTKSTYGNGDYVEYDYDKYGRVVETKHNGVVTYQYKYNASGNLAKLIDVQADGFRNQGVAIRARNQGTVLWLTLVFIVQKIR